MTCAEIANPRNQKIFVVAETTCGTPEFPSSGTDGIIGAGFVTADRSSSFTDSPEIRNSLNLKDQVKDKDAAGTWSFPILARPSGVSTGLDAIDAPAGSVLFDGLQGNTLSLTGAVDDGANMLIGAGDVSVDTLTTIPPDIGVIYIGTELVFYDGVTNLTADDADATKYQCTLNNLVRGYGGTTAAEHLDNATFSLVSPTYNQAIERDAMTIWYQQDDVTYYCTGATVSSLAFTGATTGYPTLELSGGFMSKGYAGTDHTNGTGTAETTLVVDNGDRFTANVKIKIGTDDNTGSGYSVTAVSGNNLTISPAATWLDGVEVTGFLPDVTEVGTTQANEDTQVSIGNYAASSGASATSFTALTPTAISATIDAPIQYIDNEITPDAISKYVANVRSITGSATQLMVSSELSLFTDADNDVKKSIRIRLGDGTAGRTMYLYMQRCTVQVPTVSVSEPTIEVAFDFTALDVDSEDSFQIICV